MSQKTGAAAVCQFLGQTHYLLPLFLLCGIFSGKFCEQSDFLYYKCMFSLSILPPSNGTTLLLQFNRLPLPYSRCLFTCSLLLKSFFGSVFTCFSVTEVTGLTQEKTDKLWGTFSLVLAHLFFLYFIYILFILRRLICWPLTLLVTPCRSGCVLICSYYPSAFLITSSSSRSFFSQWRLFVLFSPIFKRPSLSPLFPLSKFTLQLLSGVSRPFSSAELSEPFCSPFHLIEPTVSITILTYICLRLKISPLTCLLPLTQSQYSSFEFFSFLSFSDFSNFVSSGFSYQSLY